ncbi:hypothetical protein CASFOL_041819 [Castilleja foliolosa]|uniref:Uncharacterized protein n=1 Tax=Castilleja foliolosa TaxID=1961234 RepID=A0ABD3B8Q8_9LAMI
MKGDDDHDLFIGNNDGGKVDGNNNRDGYGDVYMDSYSDGSTDNDDNDTILTATLTTKTTTSWKVMTTWKATTLKSRTNAGKGCKSVKYIFLQECLKYYTPECAPEYKQLRKARNRFVYAGSARKRRHTIHVTVTRLRALLTL